MKNKSEVKNYEYDNYTNVLRKSAGYKWSLLHVQREIQKTSLTSISNQPLTNLRFSQIPDKSTEPKSFLSKYLDIINVTNSGHLRHFSLVSMCPRFSVFFLIDIQH